MLTAFLSRADVSRHLQALHLLQELREALTARVKSASVQSLRFAAPVAGGSTLVRQATLPGLPAYSITVRAEWPGDAKHVTREVLQLHDATSGKLMAVMDAGHLVALRASLVSALAADVLAREDAKNVAVLGQGSAASSALKALRLVRSIDRVWLHEQDVAANFELAMRLQQTLATSVRGADSVEDAVADADIVVLTGHVSLPVTSLKPGAHVTVLAPETFARPPLSPQLLAGARRFCDTSEAALDWAGPFHAELGQVLTKEVPGRTGADEVTVFVSAGPAFSDLLAAWHVFETAKTDENLTRIDLEA